MSDKKLSEVTKVTDMAYVPVILSDGSVGQIAKADLASVVAGVMGFSTNDSLTYKGVLTAELEASATLPNGVYRQNENPMLSCDGVTNLYRGQLFSFRGIADSGNYYGLQIYVTGDGVSKHSRTIEYGYVRPWQRIDNFGYNSLAELATGVANAIKTRTWTSDTDITQEPSNTFGIILNGIKITDISSNSLWGLGMSFYIGGGCLQLVHTNHGCCSRYLSGSTWSSWTRLDNV